MADTIWNNNYLLSNLDAQKLYAQSPLTTGVSGTSAWIGLEPSARYNETVLWSGVSSISANPHCLVSERPTNFEYVAIFGRGYPTHKAQLIAQIDYNDTGASENQAWVVVPAGGANGAALRFNQFACSANDTEIYAYSARQFSLQGATASTATSPTQITKIIGINRKEV